MRMQVRILGARKPFWKGKQKLAYIMSGVKVGWVEVFSGVLVITVYSEVKVIEHPGSIYIEEDVEETELGPEEIQQEIEEARI